MLTRASQWECQCATPWHRCSTHRYSPGPDASKLKLESRSENPKTRISAKRKPELTDKPLPKRFRGFKDDPREFARIRPILDPKDIDMVEGLGHERGGTNLIADTFLGPPIP